MKTELNIGDVVEYEGGGAKEQMQIVNQLPGGKFDVRHIDWSWPRIWVVPGYRLRLVKKKKYRV